MNEMEPKIRELENRIDRLVHTQVAFQTEISELRRELARLRYAESQARGSAEIEGPTPPKAPGYEKPAEPTRPLPPPERIEAPAPAPTFGYTAGFGTGGPSTGAESEFQKRVSAYAANARGDIERFIGENLISKVGIVVLIIGVGIGVKYSIDNDLISPLARIILGYLVGFGLVGLAIRLKAKYHNFSAALISGGLAIMYFVTYFAYSAYALIVQPTAFALMVMFTVLTFVSALAYSRQVIAHIGLVGAYTVPFLLSTDSGNYAALFTYMSVINAGILAISVRRYWKPIFYTSFALTWLIFFAWLSARYSTEEHFYIALLFSGVFTVIFFGTKLVHCAVHGEREDTESLVTGLATQAVFYFAVLAVLAGGVATSAHSWLLLGVAAGFSAGFLFSSLSFLGRPVAYLSFIFTWLIYGCWFIDRGAGSGDNLIASVFAALLWAMFFAAIAAYRLRPGGTSAIENAGLMLTNSFLFYGFGYSIIDGNSAARDMLGVFTAGHAVLHYLLAVLVIKLRQDAADVVQVLTILILTFTAVTVPVQFDGNIVTMIWSAEAAFLFWYGRTRTVELFEYFSLPVMLLAVCSMIADWAVAYSERTPEVSELNRIPLANGELVTALVFVGAFGLIYAANRDKRFGSPFPADATGIMGAAFATIALFALYNAFRIEIGNYFHLERVAAGSGTAGKKYAAVGDIRRFDILWQLYYSMAFVTGLAAVNIRKLKSKLLAVFSGAAAILLLAVFATLGMAEFFELRESYLAAEPDVRNGMYVAIRYIGYSVAALLVYALNRAAASGLLADAVSEKSLRLGSQGLIVVLIFISASCELLHLMAQTGIPDGSKLGLSIFWGIYSLILIGVGIARGEKHLRIAAIVLLAATLFKLFFYDVADLDTIPKTILFVTLGITLLAASFLYNKYKNVIFGTEAAAKETDV